VLDEGPLLSTSSVGGARITHCIAVSSEDEVDEGVRSWMSAAYDRARS
jgi:hypothetical protein